jgi:hypothetical protein
MNKLNKLRVGLVCLIFATLSLTSGCDDNPVSTEDENSIELMTVVSKRMSEDRLTIYTTDSLKVGYNEVYLRVTDQDGNEITLSDPEIKPIMYMPDKTHSAPVTATEQVSVNGDSYLKAEVYFIMPSMRDSQWVLSLSGSRSDGSTLDTEVEVEVANSDLQRKMVVQDRMYILTYVGPKTPVVGGDTYEVALHYKKDMMHFPAIKGATVEIDPFMDMGGGEGHGPTSVQDVADELGDGRYSGDIVYNMSGQWQLTFSVIAGDSLSATFPAIELMIE